MVSPANSRQVDGSHYKKLKLEIWDFIYQNNIPYLEGNVIRYTVRWRDKGGIKDIDKAIHYLQKIKELAELEAANANVDEVIGRMKLAVDAYDARVEEALSTMKVAGDPIPEELAHLQTSDAGLVQGVCAKVWDDAEPFPAKGVDNGS